MKMKAFFWLFIAALIFTGFQSPACHAKPSQKSLDTALLDAVDNGDTPRVKLLLEQGASANAGNEDGTTALMSASVVGGLHTGGYHPFAVTKLLISHHANVNAISKSGLTALLCAAATASPQAVRLLVSKYASIDAKDEKGMTALMYAAGYIDEGGCNGCPKSVEILLSHSASVNGRNNSGETALILAVKLLIQNRADTLAVVELLLDKGADVNSRTNNGNTALKWATMNGHWAVVRLLKNAGAKN